jgi:acetylglutamate kinase
MRKVAIKNNIFDLPNSIHKSHTLPTPYLGGIAIMLGVVLASLLAVLFSTDVAGIYRNWPDKDSLIVSISATELSEISKTFQGGMIPKAESAINAIKSGAKKVQIFDGREVSSVEFALQGEGGTLVSP